MSEKDYIGIIGVGYAVPPNIRTNDDPIFDWLKDHQQPGQDLFKGYQERRVLSETETLMDIIVPAAQQALDDAQLTGKEIDVLLGYASVSDYLTPNALAQLHRELNLRSNCWIFPINNEFTNFNAGIVVANALISAGQAKNVLIVCGCNWTRHVSYHTPQSVSAADGAGAAVVGRTTNIGRFTLIDAETVIESKGYGFMYMQADAIAPDVLDFNNNPEQIYTKPYFHITPDGQQAYVEFGEKEPPKLAKFLLKRNGLVGADIALISHQSSSVLIDAWQQVIIPGQYLQSLEKFANMTLANIPVNLAYFYRKIEKDYLVLLGVGTDLQTTAVLLGRNS